MRNKNFLFVKHDSLLNSILILWCCFASLSVRAQVIPLDKDLLNIREEINNLVTESKIPSMGIAVLKDGKILWQEAIGFTDVQEQKEANIHTLYPLGSVSKSITATGIMQMINSGALSLQQDIRPLISPILLKDINGGTPEIKLWQLLSMNAGINHGYGVYDHQNELPSTPDQLKSFFEETTIVAFEPGTVYEYSNRAFYLSELIIKNLSQTSFQEYMDQNVFYPLGMNNTVAYAYQYEGKKPFAKKYSASGLKELDTNISFPAGGSGFWSSIYDMTQYAMFHLGATEYPNVINEENLDLMHDFRQGSSDLFGIGWFNRNGTLFSNGNVGGGNASVFIDKENNLAIVCLLNKTSWDGLADQYLGKIKEVFIQKPDNGMQEWLRFYGTPYKSRYELMGKWTGTIKQPVTGRNNAVEIIFDENGEIKISVDGIQTELANVTFNLLKELEGSFNSQFPGIYEQETRSGLKLKLEGDSMYGYIQYDSFSEHRFYRLPLFIKLIRQK